MKWNTTATGRDRCCPSGRSQDDGVTCGWDGTQATGESYRAPLMSATETRELLRVSKTTLYKLLKRNKIPGATRVGRRWRFHRETLEAWLASTPNVLGGRPR